MHQLDTPTFKFLVSSCVLLVYFLEAPAEYDVYQMHITLFSTGVGSTLHMYVHKFLGDPLQITTEKIG